MDWHSHQRTVDCVGVLAAQLPVLPFSNAAAAGQQRQRQCCGLQLVLNAVTALAQMVRGEGTALARMVRGEGMQGWRSAATGLRV